MQLQVKYLKPLPLSHLNITILESDAEQISQRVPTLDFKTLE